jgi:integrase
MATIRARRQSDGTVRYTAVIRVGKGKVIIHQEYRTFSHRSAAVTWARHREVELENPEALRQKQPTVITLGELIRWYIATFETISKWQRSKQSHLEFLARHTIGQANVFELTPAALIKHVRARRADGAGPATVINDLVWIGVVLRAAQTVRDLPVRPESVQEARDACGELRLIGKARKRVRRPTTDELMRLREFFAHRDARAGIPMVDIMDFAIASARRQAEICHLEWGDNDPIKKIGLVRDAKHPTSKEGNHRRFKYTPDAWSIVQRQPKKSEYIFPYEPKSVGAAFTRATQLLGIADLRFHDLRHEATSRLFERGYQIHEVAQFTLHDSCNELKRYTNLKPENVREINSPVDGKSPNRVRAALLPETPAPPSPAADRSGGEVGCTNEPGRFLAAEAECRTGEHSCWCAAASLFETQSEVFRSYTLERDVGLAKFSQ